MAIVWVAAFVPGATALAAEISVMSGGAVKSAFSDAARSWEKRSGDTVSASYAPAGDLRRRISMGERTDILVIPAENLDALARADAIEAATRRDLAGVSIGAAVKAGAPVPDISTPEKLKAVLLAAKSITYMDPARGTSGKHFDETVLPKLGIRDAVRAKATLGEGGYIAEKVARGEVELAIHSLTEMAPVAGVTIIGPLPPGLQKTTIYAGVVMKGARHPREAQAFLDYLVSPEGRKAFLDRGYTAP
ncbi:MAG TPA: substrate-binding domain-containing protein [Usitatibacter sp.]